MLGCDGRLLQQARKRRSRRAGRTHGVGMDRRVRTREGVTAARQRGTCTCARAWSKQHPTPDALACLRPTMGSGRPRLPASGADLSLVRKVRFLAVCKFRDRAHRVWRTANRTKTPEFEFAHFFFTDISTPPTCNRHVTAVSRFLLALSGAAFWGGRGVGCWGRGLMKTRIFTAHTGAQI